MHFSLSRILLRAATKVVEVRSICSCICVKYVVYTIRPHAMNVQFSMGSLTTVRELGNV